MRPKVISLLAAAFSLGVMQAASAADMPTKAPVVKAPMPMVAPVYNWTGFYVGVNGGGVWGRTDPGYFDGTSFVSSIASQNQQAGAPDFDNSGGLAGGQIGYLTEFGKLVIGLEASFDWMKLNGSTSTTGSYVAFPAINFSFNETVNSDWLALFTARAGWDMGIWYPYITGGLAVAHLKFASSYTNTNGTPGTSGAGSFEQVRTGPTIGGGLEWRFDNHWSLRGEYLFMVFNKVSGTYNIFNPGFVPPNLGFFNFNAKFSESVARAALSYKF